MIRIDRGTVLGNAFPIELAGQVANPRVRVVEAAGLLYDQRGATIKAVAAKCGLGVHERHFQAIRRGVENVGGHSARGVAARAESIKRYSSGVCRELPVQSVPRATPAVGDRALRGGNCEEGAGGGAATEADGSVNV